jgi:malate/lactate dehydrogenase
MSKISVIGAGRLGSTIAFAIIKERICDELVMIDIIEDLVHGEELDMGQTTICPVTGSTDYKNVAGSDLVVIVAGIARKPDMTREQLLGTNVKIMKSVIENIVKHAPDTKLLIVSNPMDAMAYVALKESGFGEKRVFGMGGIVDTNRFRYFLGLELMEVIVTDPSKPGIIAGITKVLADLGVSVRQCVSEDPEFSEHAKLYIITEKPVPAKVIPKLSEPVKVCNQV